MKKLFMVIMFMFFVTCNVWASDIEIKDVVYFNPTTNTSDVFVIPYIKTYEGNIIGGEFKFGNNDVMEFDYPEKGKLVYYSLTDQSNGCYSCSFKLFTDKGTYSIKKNIKVFDKNNIEEENTVLFNYDEMSFQVYNIEMDNGYGTIQPFNFKLKIVDFKTQKWTMINLCRSPYYTKYLTGDPTDIKKIYPLNKNGYGEPYVLNTLVFKNVITCVNGTQYKMDCAFEKTGDLWKLINVAMY